MMIGAAALLLLIEVAFGDFTYSETRDPIDDTLQVSAVLESGKSRLWIACDRSRGKGVVATLETDNLLASPASDLLSDMMPFRYRIDDQPAEIAFATYGGTVAEVKGADARALVQRLAGGGKIFIRVLGVSGDLDASFSAAEARAAMERVAQTCGDQRLQARLAKNR